MKNLLLTISIIFIAFLSSCDTIDDPLQNSGGTNGGGSDTNDVTKQVVLLEEFTGVKCNNCPTAAIEAKRLQGVYGDQMILIAIHAGNLAQTDPEHPRAFRTNVGDDLFSDFGLLGVPLGFVNRVDEPAGGIAKGKDAWRTVIPDLVNRDPIAKITLEEDSYDENRRNLVISGEVEVLSELPSNNIYLSIYLVENNIISAQTLPDKSVDPNYEHNHVLRASFNGTYGESIDLVSSTTFSFSKSLTLDGDIVKENTAAVAFIYNRDTYEIIQAVEIEL